MTDWIVYTFDPNQKQQALGPLSEADAKAHAEALEQEWPTWTVEARPAEALSESVQAPLSTLPEFVLEDD